MRRQWPLLYDSFGNKASDHAIPARHDPWREIREYENDHYALQSLDCSVRREMITHIVRRCSIYIVHGAPHYVQQCRFNASVINNCARLAAKYSVG